MNIKAKLLSLGYATKRVLSGNPVEPIPSKPGLSEARKKAWETRRAKYGPSGHRGLKQDAHVGCPDCQRMREVILDLMCEGVLSEGQAVKMTGLDQITVRKYADDFASDRPYC